MLAAVKQMEFAAVRDALGVADSVVSKHLSRLVDSGYVNSWKTTSAGRSRVWVALTPSGRQAFAAHLEALRLIAAGQFEAADQFEPSQTTSPGPQTGLVEGA